MPSPIAHTALVFFGLPAAQGAARLPLSRRVALAAMLAVVLVLPDLDFALALVGLAEASGVHGTWSHSLVWALPVGLGFAMAASLVLPQGARPSFGRLALVGAAAFASHTLMDWMNWGFGNSRGVQLVWPLSQDRFLSPVPLFIGLRWSEPGAYASHAVTLSTELAFAAVVWFIASKRRRRHAALSRAEGDA